MALRLKKVEVPEGTSDPVIKDLARSNLIVFLVKAGISAIAVISGFVLILLGISPEADSTIEMVLDSYSITMSKVYPGTVLSLTGLLVLALSKYKVKITSRGEK